MRPEPHDPRRVAIHTRRVACGDSNDHLDVTVFCPLQGRALSLDECVTCQHCEGLSIDPSGHESLVRCRYHGEVEARGGSARAERVATEARRTRVAAVMSRDVVCVRPDLSLERLSELLLERGISGAPVVDGSGRAVGIVSKTDLVRAARARAEEGSEAPALSMRREGIREPLGSGFHEEVVASGVVADIMTRIAITLPEDATIHDAAEIMTRDGLHRLPVVDRDGKVVGILSALDVIRWTAERPGTP